MTKEASPFSDQPYRRRTWLRQRSPFYALGLAPKGPDCVAKHGRHEWYNDDYSYSACYHCQVVEKGQLWKVVGLNDR